MTMKKVRDHINTSETARGQPGGQKKKQKSQAASAGTTVTSGAQGQASSAAKPSPADLQEDESELISSDDDFPSPYVDLPKLAEKDATAAYPKAQFQSGDLQPADPKGGLSTLSLAAARRRWYSEVPDV